MAEAPAKRQKSSKEGPYELIYWGGMPGRGEFARLVLEEAGADYTDTAHIDNGVKEVLALIAKDNKGDGDNPPVFAPPILRHGDLVINQTPNILLYLGKRLGLAGDPEDEDAAYKLNELALTVLDGLSNEVHECHHPISTELYYEDQKDAALLRSQDYVKTRLPKFLGFFERVLNSPSSGSGPWLYGGQLTYADLVLFQGLDGTKFQFPKAMGKYRVSGDYDKVFALYDAVLDRPKIKAYLESERRQKYSLCIWRYYSELDVE